MTTAAVNNARIRPLEPADADAVARLHAAELPDGILSRLGEGFLSAFYYRRVPFSRDCACFVYRLGDELAGFVTVTSDWRRSFHKAAGRHPVSLLMSLAGVLTRGFPGWRALADAAVYLIRPPRMPDSAEAEFVSLAVAEQFRSLAFVQQTGLRVSQELGDAALGWLNRSGASQVRAMVRKDNVLAQVYYRNLGFNPAGEVNVLSGVSVVYTRDLEKPCAASAAS